MPPGNWLFLRINEFAVNTPWLHGPMTAFAKYGIVLFAVYLLVGWWLARGREDRVMAYALLAPVAAVVAIGVQQVLIGWVAEARPYTLHPDALVLVTKSADASFPSDHACVAGAVAAALFFVDRRLGWVAAVTAVVMAFARVYVGAHWPLDVVAGLAFGAAVAMLVLLLLRVPVANLVGWARRNRLRPLLASAA